MHRVFYCFERVSRLAQAEAGEFSELKCRGGLSPGDQDSWKRQDRAPKERAGRRGNSRKLSTWTLTLVSAQVGKLYKAGEGIPAVIKK